MHLILTFKDEIMHFIDEMHYQITPFWTSVIIKYSELRLIF